MTALVEALDEPTMPTPAAGLVIADGHEAMTVIRGRLDGWVGGGVGPAGELADVQAQRALAAAADPATRSVGPRASGATRSRRSVVRPASRPARRPAVDRPRRRRDETGPRGLSGPVRRGAGAPGVARPMPLARALRLGAPDVAARPVATGTWRLTDRGIAVIVSVMAVLVLLAGVVGVGRFLQVTSSQAMVQPAPVSAAGAQADLG